MAPGGLTDHAPAAASSPTQECMNGTHWTPRVIGKRKKDVIGVQWELMGEELGGLEVKTHDQNIL